MAQTPNARVTRLRDLTGVLGRKQARLDDALVRLKKAQIRTEECFRETEQQFRETDRLFRETGERSRNLDERIDRLAVEIREYLRKQGSSARRVILNRVRLPGNQP